MEKEDVIDHLYKVGGRLKKGMNDLAKIYGLENIIACVDILVGTVMTIKKVEKYNKPLITKSLIQQELSKTEECCGLNIIQLAMLTRKRY